MLLSDSPTGCQQPLTRQDAKRMAARKPVVLLSYLYAAEILQIEVPLYAAKHMVEFLLKFKLPLKLPQAAVEL